MTTFDPWSPGSNRGLGVSSPRVRVLVRPQRSGVGVLQRGGSVGERRATRRRPAERRSRSGTGRAPRPLPPYRARSLVHGCISPGRFGGRSCPSTASTRTPPRTPAGTRAGTSRPGSRHPALTGIEARKPISCLIRRRTLPRQARGPRGPLDGSDPPMGDAVHRTARPRAPPLHSAPNPGWHRRR